MKLCCVCEQTMCQDDDYMCPECLKTETEHFRVFLIEATKDQVVHLNDSLKEYARQRAELN